MTEAPHPYEILTPDLVLQSVEALGFICDGRLLALNSYENRVYQVGIEDALPIIAKFYRPARWSNAAILEEHAFALELEALEIPVVAPLRVADHTLHELNGFRIALFPRRGGHAPELDNPEHLEWLGRFLGRIHAAGKAATFQARPTLSAERFGREPIDWLRAHTSVPDYLRDSWLAAAEDLYAAIVVRLTQVGEVATLRLHGDCHPGNILWTDGGPHFVDLDDALTGPAIQDLWMFLSGDATDQRAQMLDLLEGYEEFMDFDRRELGLIEALRGLRMLHYCAWIARRWDDPAFPAAFPWFGGNAWWEEQVITLREQRERLAEPPLKLTP